MSGYTIPAAGLHADHVHAYRTNGYTFPLRTLSEERARGYLEQFERFEAAGHSRDKNPRLTFKPHLCFMWMFELVTNPVVLDAVEALIGPNILIYGSQAWNKLPNDPRFIWDDDPVPRFDLDPIGIAASALASEQYEAGQAGKAGVGS